MGAEKQAKGKVDRQPPGQAPARHSTTTRCIRTARGKPPAGVSLPPTNLQCRAGTAAGVPGAKPPAKLTYGLPLPRRGRGSGG